MKDLDLIFTRDMPLANASLVFKGYSQFQKVFGVPFAENVFVFRNGAVEIYRDMEYLTNDLPKKVHISLKEKKLDIKVIFQDHQKRVEAIRVFKTKRSGSILEQIQELNVLGGEAFLGMLLSLWIPLWAEAGETCFSENEIIMASAIREKDSLFDDCSSLQYDLLGELARTMNVDVSILKYLNLDELTLFIEKGLLPKDIGKRKHEDIYYIRGVFYGKGAALNMLHSIDYHVCIPCIKEENDIKGSIAFEGNISGRVCIVFSRDDIDKFKEGDILVAPMTTPWYLPLMKRARAFVTDEGGVMCHAAIIAREMKKPCIIGTKIATKVLKDGDVVEVDAYQGLVRITKKI